MYIDRKKAHRNEMKRMKRYLRDEAQYGTQKAIKLDNKRSAKTLEGFYVPMVIILFVMMMLALIGR